MTRKNRTQCHALPTLAFADFQAAQESELTRYVDDIGVVLEPIESCESVGVDEREFSGKSWALQVNDLAVLVCASTPVRLTVGASSSITLIIPLEGEFVLAADQQEYMCHARKTAMQISGRHWTGTFTESSLLIIRLNAQRLVQLAETMREASEGGALAIDADSIKPVSLRVRSLHFEVLLKQLCQQVEGLGCDTRLLARLKWDEYLYRHMAMMLYPDALGLMDHVQESNPMKLSSVCHYIRTHLTERITLTRLEQISGLSRRSVQYAFLKAYQQTPMEWLREQRLLKARECLQQADKGEKVKTVAIGCGFHNVATFAGYYRERFGELPSETLASRP